MLCTRFPALRDPSAAAERPWIRAVDRRMRGGHRPVVLMALSAADLERLRPVLERLVSRLRPEEIGFKPCTP